MPESEDEVRFILGNDCMFIKLWGVVYLLACFTSPYFYAWLALNGAEHENDLEYTFLFETIFAINIFLNFITDYIPEGELSAEKDIQKISDRYLHDGFL